MYVRRSFVNPEVFIFLLDFSSEKKRRVDHVHGLVLYNIPNVLQHPQEPPWQRQHQVLQVLAAALLQGGSYYDESISPTLSSVSQLKVLQSNRNFRSIIQIHTTVVRKKISRLCHLGESSNYYVHTGHLW